MNQPHPHKDLIIAWANGAKIQARWNGSNWMDICDPSWEDTIQYRIKPEPKPIIKRWQWTYKSSKEGPNFIGSYFYTEEEASKHLKNCIYKKLPWTEMEFEE